MKDLILLAFNRMKEHKILIGIPISYIIVAYFMLMKAIMYIQEYNYPIFPQMFRVASYILLIEIAIAGLLLILKLIGGFYREFRKEKRFRNCGFVDKQGNIPILYYKRNDRNIITREYFSKLISLDKYLDKQDLLQTVLNEKIISIEQGKDMQHVIIRSIKKKKKRVPLIKWEDNLLSKKDFEIVLGESEIGIEAIDISSTPHILLGGGTGSGKSKLLQLFLMQCQKKGATVYISDFKGGLDFSKNWKNVCTIITEPQELNYLLLEILSIMEERRSLFLESEVSNISDYNKKTKQDLRRVIIACDEIAEVLDKTGLAKDEKELILSIESKLSTIARQGRAFGLHLVLATQRPDSEVLKGQIKNNLGYKVCGRADKVLSQIVLDNTSAAEQIPSNAQGLFITNSGALFQAYYVDDDCI